MILVLNVHNASVISIIFMLILANLVQLLVIIVFNVHLLEFAPNANLFILSFRIINV